MTKNYLKKFIKYIKKVYRIEDALKALTDGRKNAKYTTAESVLPVLLGFIMRIQSFNELKYKIRSNDFKNIVSKRMKLPQIDTIRDTLKVTDVQGLYKLHSKILKKAKRNKVFEEGTIDGYTVVAIDGTKLFGSYKKNCNECCTTTARNKKTQYFHSAAFMSLIGKEPRLIMGFELYKGSEDSSKKDEGELTVAKRLLSRVVNEHKNTLDVVVYDALACNSNWINHCRFNKIVPIVHVKNNNISSIKEVKEKINKSDFKQEWQDDKRGCKVKGYEETFKMDEVTEPLRFVKFSKKSKQGNYSQVLLVTTDFNIPLQTLYKMMHMRWDIENSLFNKLKTYGALEHCFIHHPNAMKAILYLMNIAANLTQLFIFRRLSGSELRGLTQKEIVRLLEKELYLLKYTRQYVFDTT
ncbi:MAG: transposase [Cellulosilyticaceae bacterium]